MSWFIGPSRRSGYRVAPHRPAVLDSSMPRCNIAW
jgi:hypothetical protein